MHSRFIVSISVPPFKIYKDNKISCNKMQKSNLCLFNAVIFVSCDLRDHFPRYDVSFYRCCGGCCCSCDSMNFCDLYPGSCGCSNCSCGYSSCFCGCSNCSCGCSSSCSDFCDCCSKTYDDCLLMWPPFDRAFLRRSSSSSPSSSSSASAVPEKFKKTR